MTSRSVRAHATSSRLKLEAEEDAELAWLMKTFEQRGGVLGGDKVADLMRSFVDQPVSRLARWIVSREIVSIVYRSELLLPMFQFDEHMDLRPQCRKAVIELSGAMPSDEVASWFATPNCLLSGAPPADALARDPDGVFNAARADRFIRCGW